MRLAHLSIVFILFAVIGAFPIVPALAQAPTAEAPKFSVGDEWAFSNGSTRVVAIEGDLVVRESFRDEQCKGCRWYTNGESVVVKVIRPDGGEFKTPAVGFRALEFPLSVGKAWTYRTQFLNEQSNQSFALLHTFKVLAYEDVKTKAGSFKAFKISHSRERQYKQESGMPNNWGSAVYWYSPEVKAVIKREISSLGAVRNFGTEYELQSFQESLNKSSVVARAVL